MAEFFTFPLADLVEINGINAHYAFPLGDLTLIQGITAKNAFPLTDLIEVLDEGSAPSAVDDTYTLAPGVTHNLDVKANDTGSNSAVLAIHTIPDNGGSAVVNGDEETIDYTSLPAFLGTETFQYSLDGALVATVTVTIALPPTADIVSTPINTQIIIDVQANDIVQGVVALTGAAPTFGTASVNGNNEVVYIAGTIAGVDTFTYDIDGNGIDGTIEVTVLPEAPVAVDDTATTTYNTQVAIPVLANDTFV